MNIEALELRLEWMRLHGLDEQEIKYYLEVDPPVDAEEEKKELEAMLNIKRMEADGTMKKMHDNLQRTMKEIYLENGLPEGTTNVTVCTLCRMIVQSDEHGNFYCNHFDERPK